MINHLTLIIGLAAFLGFSGPLSAQEYLKLQITPYLGTAVFTEELPSSFSLSRNGASPLTLTGGEVEEDMAFGLTAGVDFNRRWGLDFTFAYSSAEAGFSGGDRTGISDLDLFLATGNLVFRLPAPPSRIEPYLTAGAGVKVYSFGIEDTDARTDFTASVGGGVDFRLTPLWALRLDARDFISVFDPDIGALDSEIQHDLLLTAGVSFTPPLKRRPGSDH